MRAWKVSRTIVACVALLVGNTWDPHLGAQTAQPVATPSATVPAVASATRALVDRYCVNCHNSRLRTAGLALDTVDVARIGDAAEAWEKVAVKLRTGTMPPPGSPRPDRAATGSIVSWLETSLDAAAASHPNPGRSLPLHRLNRAEYANAVRDLLALEMDARSLLPVDDSNHGFDNMATVLTVSPLLLERYMSAARTVSRLAVGDPTLSPAAASRTYTVSKTLFQDDRMSEDLPFGSRGGLAIRHYFPLDGEYRIKIRLLRNYVDYVRGLRDPQQLEVRLDGVRVKTFAIGGERPGAPAPVSYGGNISGSPEWETYAISADKGLELRFRASAGPRVVGVSFVRRPGEPEGVLQPAQTGYAFAVDETRSSPSGLEGPAVESVAIDGPHGTTRPGDTPSRRAIFSCRPSGARDEDACAKRILSRLARRAYRRPVTDEDVQTLLGFYRTGRSERDFESGIQFAIERLLCDPDFLFRIAHEPTPAASASVYRISDLDLASRLSFFLWSSIPDEELLDLATRGQLKDPAVLDRQVRRLLADARSRALVDNFAAQWLTQRALQGVAPNPDLFPEFDDNLREAFRRETELFVASQLRDDRPLVDLLTANYTFLNDRLARHYGIRGVNGSHFRRVTLAGETRGGLLGQGSILTVTSYGTRTSPVLRGYWLLENVLGTPPPPPPPNVPALPERGNNGMATSVRERMEQHRSNPACASCHVRMDPLGFALENYDAIGRWRLHGEAGTPIDASGALPDGTRLVGVSGLRDHLAAQPDEFVATATEKLLAYALGRGVELSDRPAVRRIVRDSAASDHRWSSVILGIVRSTPFLMRRSES
jgi:mono/diheme cytochrome c family protein